MTQKLLPDIIDSCERNLNLGQYKDNEAPFRILKPGELETEDTGQSAKTTALKLLFRSLTPTHLLCVKCGYNMDAWAYWETVVLEAIKMQEEANSQHLLDQLERAQDVFYAECPECGEAVDFRGENNER